MLSNPRSMGYEKVKVEKVKNVQVTISSNLHGVKELSMGETEFTKVGSYKHIWELLSDFLMTYDLKNGFGKCLLFVLSASG